MSNDFVSIIISKILESRIKESVISAKKSLQLFSKLDNKSHFYSIIQNSNNNYGEVIFNTFDENYVWNGINGIYLKYNVLLYGLKLVSGYFVSVFIDLDNYALLKANLPIFADSDGNFCVIQQFCTLVDFESRFEESLFVPSGILINEKNGKNISLGLLVYVNELNNFVLSKFIKIDVRTLSENTNFSTFSNMNNGIIDNKELSIIEESIVTLISTVIMADNVTKPEEMSVVRDFFDKIYTNSPHKFAKVRSLLRSFSHKKPSVEQACYQLAKELNFNDRLVILALLFSIATSDGDIKKCEIEAIDEIREKLEIPKNYFDKMLLDFNPSDYKFYKILGLEPGSDFESIQSAWLEKTKVYNPTSIMNMPETFKEFAIKEYQKINEAYQYFLKKFNK